MSNPFGSVALTPPDEELLAAARAGDRGALETLLARHQPWVFNFALRMLWRYADAEDATQEVLLKVFRALPAFRGESKFTTWLYRIAVNHILNLRRDAVCSFAEAARSLQETPDFDPPDPRTVPVPFEILVEETKTSCMIGTLLCLDGRQRLVFILGEVFGVGDEVGSEIAGVTPANFRQILSRARRDLYEYLRGNCSLVNPDAPCKCARKTRAFIEGGFVDPQRLQFTSNYLRRVRDVAGERAEELMGIYRDQPFYEASGYAQLVKAVSAEISAT